MCICPQSAFSVPASTYDMYILGAHLLILVAFQVPFTRWGFSTE